MEKYAIAENTAEILSYFKSYMEYLPFFMGYFNLSMYCHFCGRQIFFNA